MSSSLDSSPFAARTLGPWSLLHAAGVEEALLLRWRDLLNAWREGAPLADARPLNGGSVFRVGAGAETMVFKRNIQLGWKSLATRLGARQSPLERAFRVGLEARAQGLHTPEPLACFQRELEHGHETVLITRFLRGSQPWRFLRERPGDKPRLFALLGREIASWHARGYRHRDLKEPNLLYSPDEDALHLLDLDGAHRVWPLPSTPVRVQDLGRLQASALSGGMGDADWEMLLRCYLEASRRLGIAIERPRVFDCAVRRRAQRKLRRNRQHQRPLA